MSKNQKHSFTTQVSQSFSLQDILAITRYDTKKTACGFSKIHLSCEDKWSFDLENNEEDKALF